MPTVYVPQLPSRYDAAVKVWVPSININPAARFGELKIMFRPGSYDLALAPTICAMKEQMADYQPEDMVVAVGDPSLMAAAAAIAARKTGGLVKLLKWDRLSRDYIMTEFHV